MLPLELLQEPLKYCTRCGSEVAPPVGPSFVYGVGAIGFQTCLVCGERWRCYWPTRRSRRGFPRRTAALVAAGAIVVSVGVAAYANTRSSKPPELAAATRGAGTSTTLRGPMPSPAGARYLVAVTPTNVSRVDLMEFLASAPTVTPQSEIDRRVAVFAASAREAHDALVRVHWPPAAAPLVAQVILADSKFVTELQEGGAQLNISSFSRELERDARAVASAADQVREDLGLAPLQPLDDDRFSLI